MSGQPAALTREQVMTALRSCIDPELNIDIVSLGLVYDVAVDDGKVTVTMTLTTPGCPLHGYFRVEIDRLLRKDSQVKDVQVDITFDPPWTPDRIQPETRKILAMQRG